MRRWRSKPTTRAEDLGGRRLCLLVLCRLAPEPQSRVQADGVARPRPSRSLRSRRRARRRRRRRRLALLSRAAQAALGAPPTQAPTPPARGAPRGRVLAGLIADPDAISQLIHHFYFTHSGVQPTPRPYISRYAASTTLPARAGNRQHNLPCLASVPTYVSTCPLLSSGPRASCPRLSSPVPSVNSPSKWFARSPWAIAAPALAF